VLLDTETNATLEFDAAYSLGERKSFEHVFVEQQLLEPKHWRSVKAGDIRREVLTHIRRPVVRQWIRCHQTRKKSKSFVEGTWDRDTRSFQNTKRTTNGALAAVVAGFIEAIRDHLLPFLDAEEKFLFIEMNVLVHASSVDPEEAAVLETAMLMAKMAKDKSKRCLVLAAAHCENLNIPLGGKTGDKVLKDQLKALCVHYEIIPVPATKGARLAALAPKFGLCT
jgi:hypothetical protein